MTTIKKPRKIIQIVVVAPQLIALSDDGQLFVWESQESGVPDWSPLPPLPPIEYTVEAVTF